MNEAERRSIHALAVRFADGERAAFQPLFAALHPLVLALVRRSLAGADADDAAQEAMVKVFARIVELDPSRDVVAWALGIASYEVLTARRRHGRSRHVDGDPDATEADAPTPESSAIAAEMVEDLARYLGSLGDDERIAIERDLRGEVSRTERDRKRRWRALDRLRRFWRTTHG